MSVAAIQMLFIVQSEVERRYIPVFNLACREFILKEYMATSEGNRLL
jgi:hypothetical protein